MTTSGVREISCIDLDLDIERERTVYYMYNNNVILYYIYICNNGIVFVDPF